MRNNEPGRADAVGMLEPNRMDGPDDPNWMAMTCDDVCPERIDASWQEFIVDELTALVAVTMPVIAAVPAMVMLLEPAMVFVTVSVFASVNG